MYAVLHPPNFFAQAAVQSKPALRKQPFVVFDGEPPEDSVFALSRAARILGVELGMSRLQAESWPVVGMQRDVEAENQGHLRLHEIACGFSPRIECVAERPGTYALDIRGMNTIFGDATQLATKLRQRIMTAGLIVQVGVSANFHTAVCLACGRTGVSVVPQGEEARALAGLPLSVLQLEARHTETFHTWGLRTCGELAALTETDLISRLGQDARRLHALARGVWPHLMAPLEPSFEAGLVERADLDFPVDDLQRLLFLISRMTTALLERVRMKALAIASIHVVLDLEGGQKHERIVKPALPLQDTPTLLKLIQLDLELHPPSAGVLAVEMRAGSAPPYRAQHGLFLPQTPEPGQTEVLLARLRKLLGEDRVGSPALTDNHRPNVFRMVPFQPPVPKLTECLKAFVPIALRVCRPPQAIAVQLLNERPVRLRWDAIAYEILEAAGPVRVSGQWWSEASWCREEWDVRLASNAAERVCRIAYDPRSRCWYMQGAYD